MRTSARVRRAWGLVVCTALALGAACGDNRSAPLEPSPAPDPPAAVGDVAVAGRAVDALSGTPMAGVTIRVTGHPDVTTDEAGVFVVPGGASGLPRRPITAESPAIVARTTYVRVPDSAVHLTLIPASFDLASFDAMFRGDGHLRRWTRAPRLVVARRALTYVDNATTLTATDQAIDDIELQQLVDDLRDGLATLTGGTFTAFADVRIEEAAAGTPVQLSRTDTIFVFRADGLHGATRFDGYTRWFWNDDGEVVRAVAMLDREYDASASALARRALRIHELGHALGWRHVEGITSVMNPRSPALPTEFDRAGAVLAFARAPLNRSPDVDTPGATVNRTGERLYSAEAP